MSVHSARVITLAEWTLWINPECPTPSSKTIADWEPLKFEGAFHYAVISELGVGHSGLIRSVHSARGITLAEWTLSNGDDAN